MTKYEAGFIGAGSMGGALAQAAVKTAGGGRVAVACSTPEHSEEAAARLGCAAETAETILWESRFVFLGVKPQMIAGVVKKLAGDIAGSDAIFVSMLAGTSLERLAELLGADKKIIRIMPNTPVSVGAGMVLYTANSLTTKSELAEFTSALELAGETDEISEEEMDAASVISGCAPAFVFMFMKALADAGVRIGLDEKKSLFYAGQTLLGAAKLAIETGKAPDQLKTEVCSPGGTTIEGVKSLAADGLEKVVSRAVSASYQRTLELAGKKS